MTNAIPDLAPQQAVVEASSGSAEQPGSPEASFSDALNAAVSGEQVTGPEAPQPKGKSNNDAPAEVVSLAGAIQVAMAIPAQPNVAIAIQDAPRAADVAVIDAAQPAQPQSAQIDQTQAATPEQRSGQPFVAASLDQPVEDINTETPRVSVPTTESGQARVSVQAEPAPTMAKPSVAVPAQAGIPQQAAVVAPEGEAPVEPIAVQGSRHPGLDSGPSAAQAAVAEVGAPVGNPVTTQVQAGQIAQQAEPLAEQLEPEKDAPVVKADEPKATGKHATDASVKAQASNVPVETVPVQWRFDGSSQSPRIITGTGAAELVQSVTDPASKAAGGESGPAALRHPEPDSGPATPMGLQFTAQLREAAQRIAPASSGSDLPTRVIDQVVRQVSLARIDGRDSLVVKLNPPDLGNLQLRITQDTTGMTTHIQAGSSQVRGLLEAHLPLLMDSLAKAGLQMDAVSVSVGTSFNAFAGSAQQQDAQPNSNHSRQQFIPNGRMGGVGTIADASYPMWGRSEQAGHSWLA